MQSQEPKNSDKSENLESDLVQKIIKLKKRELELDRELKSLSEYTVDSELKLRMELLHVYNDVKDATQVVLGRLAILKGVSGKTKKTRRIAQQRFAQMKKMISLSDSRIKEKDRLPSRKKKSEDPHQIKVREVPQVSSALFFQYNTQLGPPYHILVDTNFINQSIKFKLDIIQSMMDCLYAKCIPYVTDCVVGELEKLGQKYRIALRIIKDPRFERIHCMHKGTYADDCIVQRVTQHKCYIVATCDRDLKKRIRKIPGVPIMFVAQHRYTIERMPDAYGAPKV